MAWSLDFDSLRDRLSTLDIDDIADRFKSNGKVSYWKVLGGAAAGVAAVVALPVAGGVGAVTAVGAAVGIAVGGAAGAVSSMTDDTEDRAEARGEAHGREKAAAEYKIRYDRMRQSLEATLKTLKSERSYFDLIVALHAVGISCAACDGPLTTEERRDIDAFVDGPAVGKMPDSVRQKLDAITATPPNVDTAFALVKELGVDSWSLFDDVIEVAIWSDHILAPEESQFRDRWAELRAEA